MVRKVIQHTVVSVWWVVVYAKKWSPRICESVAQLLGTLRLITCGPVDVISIRNIYLSSKYSRHRDTIMCFLHSSYEAYIFLDNIIVNT